MNIKLLLVLIIFPMSLFAGKYNLSVKVVNAYDLTVLEGCSVSLADTDFKAVTNLDGTVIFENVKGSKFQIQIVPPSDFFYPEDLNYNMKYHGKELLIELMPTEKYDLELYRIEDSIYGSDRDSVDLIDVNIVDSLIEVGAFIDAEFMGGNSAMTRFIVDNVRYPQIAIELNEQGKVYLTFVVEKNGDISHVRVAKGISRVLDSEAKRVVRRMPNWKSGTVNDENVRVKIHLPIVFAIQ